MFAFAQTWAALTPVSDAWHECDRSVRYAPGVRAWIAAALGGVAGAAAAFGVVSLQTETPAPPPADTSSLTREIATLRERLDRVERGATARPRVPTEPPASWPSAETPDVPEGNGRWGGKRPVAAETPADLSKVSSEDLAIEADDRHTHDFDISGAAKRYRELLSRAGTPAERRHWNIRLGDCYFRLQMWDESMRCYRDCVDASTEDHPERVGCMVALAKHDRTTDPAAARRWIDRALELSEGRSNRAVHEMAAFLARDADQSDVEIRELTWLVEHFPAEANADAGWKERIAELRGEKR